MHPPPLPVPRYDEFQGKRALITGGTQGIGKAIALRIARNGARVFLTYSSNEKAAAETLAEFQAAGLAAETVKADMSDPAALSAMLEKTLAPAPIDYLVCNAAYQAKVGFFETDAALFHKTFGVNILGNFQVIRAVADRLIAEGRPGAMVMCSSGHGKHVFNGTFAYDVSKAALNHFMRCSALELVARNIRMNAIDIGWTHTPGERRWFTEAQQNELSRTIPIGRAADADEVAAVAEFLLSEQARYVVGSLYLVDGGFALQPNPNT